MTERRARRWKQLLVDLEEKIRYWKLKEALRRCVVKVLCDRLWSCLESDYKMNE
jgi:hypothetical protein